jgi:SAM-dependent methyltransferase
VASDRDEAGRGDVAYRTFGGGWPTWLGRLDKVRNVVRQEMLARQLDRHMQGRSGRILEVGAGQGTQSIRLARAGHQVLAVEPDPDMRTAFGAALGAEHVEVRERVTVRDGSAGRLAAVTDGGVHDAVLLLGGQVPAAADGVRGRKHDGDRELALPAAHQGQPRPAASAGPERLPALRLIHWKPGQPAGW